MGIHPMNEEAFQTIDAMMFSGSPSPEEIARLQYFIARWTAEIPNAEQLNKKCEEENNTVLFFGNECTGDLTKVRNFVDTLSSENHNWIEGTKGKFKFQAKVFSIGSTFGIKDGRISKIQVCDVTQPHWGFNGCYINYDRGWDIRPSDPEALEFLNGLLEAFGGEPLADDDLVWYDLYGYQTEEDFNNRNREHLGSFGSMDDALSEGRWFLEEGHDYSMVKVISNDDETIEIIRKSA